MEEFRESGKTYRWDPETGKIYEISNVDHARNYIRKKADSIEVAKQEAKRFNEENA